MDPFLALELIEPGLAVAAGTALLWFPGQFRRLAQRRNAERLAELEAGGEESYFEERRALKAYAPTRRDFTWQLLGAVFVIIGAFQIFMLVAD
jgi:hypothetical protein